MTDEQIVAHFDASIIVKAAFDSGMGDEYAKEIVKLITLVKLLEK